MTETTALRLAAALSFAALLVGAKTTEPKQIVVQDADGNGVTITPEGIAIIRKDGSSVAITADGPAILLRDAAKTSVVTISAAPGAVGIRAKTPDGSAAAGVTGTGGFVGLEDGRGAQKVVSAK